MSVALVVKSAPDPRDRHLPIATEDVFEDFWLPAAHALHLKWVPTFQSGLDVRHQDIPDILNELLRLKVWMTKPERKVESEAIVRRIVLLTHRLEEIQHDPAASAWIG